MVSEAEKKALAFKLSKTVLDRTTADIMAGKSNVPFRQLNPEQKSILTKARVRKQLSQGTISADSALRQLGVNVERYQQEAQERTLRFARKAEVKARTERAKQEHQKQLDIKKRQTEQRNRQIIEHTKQNERVRNTIERAGYSVNNLKQARGKPNPRSVLKVNNSQEIRQKKFAEQQVKRRLDEKVKVSQPTYAIPGQLKKIPKRTKVIPKKENPISLIPSIPKAYGSSKTEIIRNEDLPINLSQFASKTKKPDIPLTIPDYSREVIPFIVDANKSFQKGAKETLRDYYNIGEVGYKFATGKEPVPTQRADTTINDYLDSLYKGVDGSIQYKIPLETTLGYELAKTNKKTLKKIKDDPFRVYGELYTEGAIILGTSFVGAIPKVLKGIPSFLRGVTNFKKARLLGDEIFETVSDKRLLQTLEKDPTKTQKLRKAIMGSNRENPVGVEKITPDSFLISGGVEGSSTKSPYILYNIGKGKKSSVFSRSDEGEIIIPKEIFIKGKVQKDILDNSIDIGNDIIKAPGSPENMVKISDPAIDKFLKKTGTKTDVDTTLLENYPKTTVGAVDKGVLNSNKGVLTETEVLNPGKSFARDVAGLPDADSMVKEVTKNLPKIDNLPKQVTPKDPVVDSLIPKSTKPTAKTKTPTSTTNKELEDFARAIAKADKIDSGSIIKGIPKSVKPGIVASAIPKAVGNIPEFNVKDFEITIPDVKDAIDSKVGQKKGTALKQVTDTQTDIIPRFDRPPAEKFKQDNPLKLTQTQDQPFTYKFTDSGIPKIPRRGFGVLPFAPKGYSDEFTRGRKSRKGRYAEAWGIDAHRVGGYLPGPILVQGRNSKKVWGSIDKRQRRQDKIYRDELDRMFGNKPQRKTKKKGKGKGKKGKKKPYNIWDEIVF